MQSNLNVIKDSVDDRMEFLEATLRLDVVGYHNFTQRYNKDDKGEVVYCFTEGEDYKYYKSRIDTVTDKDSIFIECNGRDGVVAALKLIQDIDFYNDDIIIGFVDRDFFSIEVPSNILVTDYYSIESYYCQQKSVRDILGLHYKLVKDETLNRQVFEQYKTLHSQFINQISFFSVWCYLQVLNTQNEKRLTFEESDNVTLPFIANESIDLKRFNLLNYIEMTLDYVIAPQLQSVSDIIDTNKKAFRKAKIISDDLVSQHLNSISSSELLLLIRGKFEMQFLKKFLQLKLKELNLVNNKGLNTDLSDLLSTLSPYANTSPKLREFVDSIV